MIDAASVSSEEDGFHLSLGGDFEDEMSEYLLSVRSGGDSMGFRISSDAAIQLYEDVVKEIGPWYAEMRATARAILGVVDGDAGEGYDLDDPKHPTYHERMSGYADD